MAWTRGLAPTCCRAWLVPCSVPSQAEKQLKGGSSKTGIILAISALFSLEFLQGPGQGGDRASGKRLGTSPSAYLLCGLGCFAATL